MSDPELSEVLKGAAIASPLILGGLLWLIGFVSGFRWMRRERE